MPIPSFTGKQSIGTQIVFIKDGNIFSDDSTDDTGATNIADINDQTKMLLPANDGIEYSHISDEPDKELQRFLDEKN